MTWTWSLSAAITLALNTLSLYCSFAFLFLVEFEQRMRRRRKGYAWPPPPPPARFTDSLTHLISMDALLSIALAVLYLDPCITCGFSTNPLATGVVALIVLLRPFYVVGASIGALAQSATQGQGQRWRRDKRSRLLLSWLPLVTGGAALLWSGLIASYGLFSYTARQVVIVILLFLALLVNTACLVALMVVLQWSRSQGGAAEGTAAAAAAATSNGRPIDSRNTSTTVISSMSFSSSSMLVTPRRVQAAARSEFEVMMQQARRASGLVPQPQPPPQPQLRYSITPLPPGTAEKLHDAFVHNGVGCDAQHEAHDDPFVFLEALALAAAHDPTSTKAIDEALTRLCICLAGQWLSCTSAVPWLLYPLLAPGEVEASMPRGLFLLFVSGAALACECPLRQPALQSLALISALLPPAVTALLPALHALLSRDKPISEVAPLRPQPRRTASAPLPAKGWRAASATIKTRIASLGSLWRPASSTPSKPITQSEVLLNDKHAQPIVECTNENSIIIHPVTSSIGNFSSSQLSSPGQGRNEYYQSATPFASPARVPGAYAHPAILSFTFGDVSSSRLGLQGQELSEAVLLPPISAGTSLSHSFVYHDVESSRERAAGQEEQEGGRKVEYAGEAWHSFTAAEPVADEDADESFGVAPDLKLDDGKELQGLDISHYGQVAAASPAKPVPEALAKPFSRAPSTIPTSQTIFLLSPPPRPTEPRSHFSSPTVSSPGMTSVSYSTSFSVLSDRKRQGSPARQLGQEREQELKKPLCSSPARARGSSGRGGQEEEEEVVEGGVAEMVGSSFISLQTIAAVTSCCEVEEKDEVTLATAENAKGPAATQKEQGCARPASRTVAVEEGEDIVSAEQAAAAVVPPSLPSNTVSSPLQRPATALSHRHSVPQPSAPTNTPGCGAERPTLCSTLGLAAASTASTPASAAQALRRRSLGSELGLCGGNPPPSQLSSKQAGATKTTARQDQSTPPTSTPATAAAAADCTLSSFTSSLLLSPDVSPDKGENGILAAVLAPLSPEVGSSPPLHDSAEDEEDVGEESGPVRLDLRGLTPLQLHAYKWPHGNLSTVAEQSEEFREGMGSDAGSQQVEEVDVAGTVTLMQVSQGEAGCSGCEKASEEAWLHQEESDPTIAGNEVWLRHDTIDATVAGSIDPIHEAASSSFIGAAPFHSSATPYRVASHDHDLASLSPFTLAEETMECLLNTSAAAAAAATAASCVRMTPLDYGFAPPLPPTSPLSISSSSYEFVHPLVTSPERRNSLLISNTPPARHHPQGRGRRSLLLAEKLGAKRRPRSVSGLLGMGGGGSGSAKRATINKDTIGLPLCNVAAAEPTSGEKLLPQLPGEACNPALFYGNDSLLLQDAQTEPAAPRPPLPPPPPTAWRATEDSMDDRIATAVETQYGLPDPATATGDTSTISTIVAGSVVIRSIKRKAVPSQQQQQQRLSTTLSSPASTMTNTRRAGKSRSLPPAPFVPITPARTEELRSYAQADVGLQVAIDAALRGGCPSTSARAGLAQEQNENAPPAAAMRQGRSSMPPLRPQRPRRPLEPFVPTTVANTSSTATSSGKDNAALRPAPGLLPLAQARAPRAPMPRRHIVSVAPECLRKNGGWI